MRVVVPRRRLEHFLGLDLPTSTGTRAGSGRNKESEISLVRRLVRNLGSVLFRDVGNQAFGVPCPGFADRSGGMARLCQRCIEPLVFGSGWATPIGCRRCQGRGGPSLLLRRGTCISERHGAGPRPDGYRTALYIKDYGTGAAERRAAGPRGSLMLKVVRDAPELDVRKRPLPHPACTDFLRLHRDAHRPTHRPSWVRGRHRRR